MGTPLLIEPADDRAYNELLVSICAAVKPANVLEEMFVADVVILHWEILALRRFKSSLIAKITYEELRDFLHSAIDYDMVRADFEQRLVQELQANWPEDENEKLAKKLARQCVEDEPEAVEKVNQILGTVEESSQSIFWSVKEEKAEDLARSYTRRDRDAIEQVDELLAASNLTLHDITIDRMMNRLDDLGRIDRLITSTENRRGVALREIDRRWSRLGEQLHRNLPIEEGVFELIEAKREEGKSTT